MKVLISNDDGVYAEGIWTLARQISKFAEVTIMAPDREQSAVGTAVTLRRPLRVQKISPLSPGIEAYAVEGTPSDSVIVALGKVLHEKVDLVVSGINHGSNLGEDVLISGTVGAALAAHLRGFPAMAVSTGKWTESYLNDTARLVALLVARMAEVTLPPGMFLNFNVPDLPLTEAKGLKITYLAHKSHVNSVEEGHDGKKAYYMLVRSAVNEQEDKRTDIWAVNHGYASITPLHLFLNGRLPPLLLEKLTSGLLEEFKGRS